MLPSLQLLEKVGKKIMSVPNRRKESKRGVHYGLFLLGYKSGLRISEAIRLDLANKTPNGLYSVKSKGNRKRFVYIPKKVIRELKKSNWKPNQTNRWNFYHFLRKIKRELNISKEIELSPHTLRRSFTTYQAESGMPLPLLQKLLGHASIRTTALYWRNIYQEPDNGDIGSILAGGDWLENKETPITENFPEQLPKDTEPIFIVNKPAITKQKPVIKDNYLSPTFIEPKPAINYQSKPLINKQQEKFSLSKEFSSEREKFPLNITNEKNNPIVISEPLPIILETQKKRTEKETILLTKIKHLEEQLRKTKTERDNLRIEKQKAEVIARQEKQRADNYQQQLKTIAKAFSQWQKFNYQQLEKERKTELEAKVEQVSPFRKINNSTLLKIY